MTKENTEGLISDKCEVCGLPVYARQGFNAMTLNHFSCKKKVALTKQNKAEYEQKLTRILGNVKLNCDGFDVILAVEVSKMKLLVTTYVNGVFKGVWMNPKEGDDYPERKFLNKKVIRAYSPKKKAYFIKKLGKKRAYELLDLDRETFYFTPVWASGKQAISHMLKVCKNVEVYI